MCPMRFRVSEGFLPAVLPEELMVGQGNALVMNMAHATPVKARDSPEALKSMLDPDG